MTKSSTRGSPVEHEPSLVEVAAAGMAGFCLVCLLVYTVRCWSRGSAGMAGCAAFGGLVGAFLWAGGRGLRRARTWTVATKMSGGTLVLIGLTTVVTGYRTEGGGSSMMWHRVDRFDDLDVIVLGLLLIGAAHLFEARLKSKRAGEVARANPAERAPPIARPQAGTAHLQGSERE